MGMRSSMGSAAVVGTARRLLEGGGSRNRARTGYEGGPNEIVRPMTAVRAAGYTSATGRSTIIKFCIILSLFQCEFFNLESTFDGMKLLLATGEGAEKKEERFFIEDIHIKVTTKALFYG